MKSVLFLWINCFSQDAVFDLTGYWSLPPFLWFPRRRLRRWRRRSLVKKSDYIFKLAHTLGRLDREIFPSLIVDNIQQRIPMRSAVLVSYFHRWVITVTHVPHCYDRTHTTAHWLLTLFEVSSKTICIQLYFDKCRKIAIEIESYVLILIVRLQSSI